MNYHNYIASTSWIIKKKEVYALQGKYCQRCGDDRYGFLNVHHIHYKTLGNEDPNRDLCVLCKNCHAEYHSIFGNDPDEFSFKKFVKWNPKVKEKVVVRYIKSNRRPVNTPEAKARKKEASVALNIERMRIREERAKKFFDMRQQGGKSGVA